MHVLIADDDPVYRGLLEDLLGQWGYEVTSTCNGQQAWEAIQREGTIEIAILDWVMPEMDGYEICHRIKQDSDKQHIYTILVTGSRFKEEIIKVLVAGADDYIIKPFEPLDLKIHLRSAMRIVNLEAEIDALRESAKAV
ncbi:MAG: response regulator [Phycisphaerae bacterium]|nr:response regulator [Phycisphaerae bacterium]